MENIHISLIFEVELSSILFARDVEAVDEIAASTSLLLTKLWLKRKVLAASLRVVIINGHSEKWQKGAQTERLNIAGVNFTYDDYVD